MILGFLRTAKLAEEGCSWIVPELLGMLEVALGRRDNGMGVGWEFCPPKGREADRLDEAVKLGNESPAVEFDWWVEELDPSRRWESDPEENSP